eukprot:1660334-Amphidinium_carterae.1
MFGILWTTAVTDAGYYWYFYNSVTRNDPTKPDARHCETHTRARSKGQAVVLLDAIRVTQSKAQSDD